MTPNDYGMTEDDKKVLSDFLVINETLKRLDKDKKKLTEEVKNIFAKYNINDVSLDHDGSTLTVTDSVRKTVLKKTKDEFVQKLIEMNKTYLVMKTIDIDTDGVYTELQNGMIDKDFVEKYMSIVDVKTLTCK